MEYSIKSAPIRTVIGETKIEAHISGGSISTTIGEGARMNVSQATVNIESGKAEIQKAVNQGKQELDTEGQQYVDLAKDWATKTDGTVDGEDYSSKYYAQQITPIASDITTVAGIASDVTTVGGIADDVSAVASNSTDISTVAGISSDVTTVAGDLTNINAVASDLTNIDNASIYAAEAKQWAIGDPTEPTGNSAKYWADEAASTLSSLTARVEDIEEVIPSDASDTNQLADKDYVDTADSGLQSQIDALVVSSDVFDVVGTYAELQAYDISTVPVNDIIKVLTDSTHSDAATYYRCVESGGVKSWSYIGSEGPYYTKSEADTLFPTKANTGSALDYTGTTLSLQNSGGTTLSSVTIKSTPDLDNVTIDTNSSDELEAIGVIEKNAGGVKYDWIGTLAEYNTQAVGTNHPDWVCYITDDNSGGTSVYTKAEVDSLISGLLADTTSTASSNYIKLGDWLVQWGTSGTLSPNQGANDYEDILFQQNFANTNYTVILSHINGGSGYAGTALNANNIAVGSFRLNCWGQDSAGTTQAAWLAIGKGA